MRRSTFALPFFSALYWYSCHDDSYASGGRRMTDLEAGLCGFAASAILLIVVLQFIAFCKEYG